MRSGNSPELRRRVLDALASADLVVDGAPDCSGELAYCGTTKKPSGTDGRYAVHLDWPPNVWLCNYHEGGEGRTVPLWEKGTLDAMPEAEREALRERIRQEKEEAAQRLEERRREIARRASGLFRSPKVFPPAGPDNAYLSRKGALPLGDLREAQDGRLLVPVLNAEDRIVNLQFIAGDGTKRFLKGGESGGCYCPIPAKDKATDGPLLIGEGVATVLSVCMATGHAGLVAFYCGNLEAVARVAREKYPEREIILCADNDCETGGNPGVTRAIAAARGRTLTPGPPTEGGKGVRGGSGGGSG